MIQKYSKILLLRTPSVILTTGSRVDVKNEQIALTNYYTRNKINYNVYYKHYYNNNILITTMSYNL